MGYGQAEQQPLPSSSSAAGESDLAPGSAKTQTRGKQLFRRGEKVAIGASGGKGEDHRRAQLDNMLSGSRGQVVLWRVNCDSDDLVLSDPS